MKIVKFQNGTYGIRKRFMLFFYVFYDFHETYNRWRFVEPKKCYHYQQPDLVFVQEIFDWLNRKKEKPVKDYGEPIEKPKKTTVPPLGIAPRR